MKHSASKTFLFAFYVGVLAIINPFPKPAYSISGNPDQLANEKNQQDIL